MKASQLRKRYFLHQLYTDLLLQNTDFNLQMLALSLYQNWDW